MQLENRIESMKNYNGSDYEPILLVLKDLREFLSATEINTDILEEMKVALAYNSCFEIVTSESTEESSSAVLTDDIIDQPSTSGLNLFTVIVYVVIFICSIIFLIILFIPLKLKLSRSC